jgi:hypothetical protein
VCVYSMCVCTVCGLELFADREGMSVCTVCVCVCTQLCSLELFSADREVILLQYVCVLIAPGM